MNTGKLTPQRLAELRAMPEPSEAVLRATAEKLIKILKK